MRDQVGQQGNREFCGFQVRNVGAGLNGSVCLTRSLAGL